MSAEQYPEHTLLTLVLGDLTRREVDAIVNAASSLVQTFTFRIFPLHRSRTPACSR